MQTKKQAARRRLAIESLNQSSIRYLTNTSTKLPWMSGKDLLM